jgi:uronate dehydrogenase
MRILVTGATGAIGAPLTASLRSFGEDVRGFDCRGAADADDFVLGDIADPGAVEAAVKGTDAIVHLAAVPDEAPFPELVGPNVFGPFHVLDAARRHGVRRVVLASSVQTASGLAAPRRVDTRAPSNHYAVTKLFAEDLGELYARRFGLDVIAARIGWMVRTPHEARRIQELNLTSWYVSRGDVARFVHAALHASFTGFATAYVIGPAAAPQFDLEPGQRLFGFTPKDEFPNGLPFEVPVVA